MNYKMVGADVIQIPTEESGVGTTMTPEMRDASTKRRNIITVRSGQSSELRNALSRFRIVVWSRGVRALSERKGVTFAFYGGKSDSLMRDDMDRVSPLHFS